MVKKFRKQHVITPIDLLDAGSIAPPTITSMTLFITVFFNGFVGPCFLIIPEKHVHINKEVIDQFQGDFVVKLFKYFFIFILFIYEIINKY